jgi:phosphatidylserine decarboxylase
MRGPNFEVRNERVSMLLQTSFGLVGIVIVGAPIVSSVKTLVDEVEVAAGKRIAKIR